MTVDTAAPALAATARKDRHVPVNAARTTVVYSHVMPALAREAADRMGTALWGPERN